MFLTFNTLLNSNIYINYCSSIIYPTNYKFIYKIYLWLNICILDFVSIALYLYKLYLYMYNLSFLNEQLLFIGSKYTLIFNHFITKICKLLNYNYIITWIPGLLTNWVNIKKKLILFKWLKYIIFNHTFNLLLSKNCMYNLYNIYNKLNLYFQGIIFYKLPKYIFLLNIKENLILNEILKLKLILISFINLSIDSSLINIKILGNYTDYKSLKLIFNIIYISLLHGKIKNM